MSVSFKAFLYERSWRGDPVEIRRFNVDQGASASYAYILQKLAQVFPSVTTETVSVAWTDSDGDLISISSDEELVEALDQFDGNLFKIYLLKKNTADKSPSSQSTEDKCGDQSHSKGQRRHWGVVCDGCNGPVTGIRYKCLVCADYDLCSVCEGKGVHVDHNMITITEPRGFYGFGGAHGGCGGPRVYGPPWGQWSGNQGCGRRRRGPCSGQSESGKPKGKCGQSCGQDPPKDQSGPEPMETEQHRDQIRTIGQAVSSFLQPFGIKVDVDVLGKATGDEKGTEAPEDTTGATAKVSSEVIEKTLAQLKAMGYEDDEGVWLTELIKAKEGDISKVLDALHFTETD